MANKVVFEMFSIIFVFIFISNVSFSLPVAEKEEKCNYYSLCSKNFTTNSIRDVQKISACERGCRFYNLMLHTSHENNDLKNIKENCLQSCSESYLNPEEASACNFGCIAVENSRNLCTSMEIQRPQISYTFVIEESDVLIHPGEPEPDDFLTDPGLRRQIQNTLVALLDATPKIPEIRFKNLPVKSKKLSESLNNSFLCPKFYGFDSKFELRNGKIMFGDLYLFLGILILVLICLLMGHILETKNIRRQLMELRIPKKDDFDKKPFLKVDVHESEIFKAPPDYSPNKTKVLDCVETALEQFDTKLEGIALVFHDEDFTEDAKSVNDFLKI